MNTGRNRRVKDVEWLGCSSFGWIVVAPCYKHLRSPQGWWGWASADVGLGFPPGAKWIDPLRYRGILQWFMVNTSGVLTCPYYCLCTSWWPIMIRNAWSLVWIAILQKENPFEATIPTPNQGRRHVSVTLKYKHNSEMWTYHTHTAYRNSTVVYRTVLSRVSFLAPSTCG